MHLAIDEKTSGPDPVQVVPVPAAVLGPDPRPGTEANSEQKKSVVALHS
jgi:hypothetical protein